MDTTEHIAISYIKPPHGVPKRIAICGTREANEKVDSMAWRAVQNAFDENKFCAQNDIVMHGAGHKGIDKIVDRIAAERGYAIVRYNPNWLKHGKKSVFMQSEDMILRGGATEVWFFHWDISLSRVTRHMLELTHMYKVASKIYDIPDINYSMMTEGGSKVKRRIMPQYGNGPSIPRIDFSNNKTPIVEIIRRRNSDNVNTTTANTISPDDDCRTSLSKLSISSAPIKGKHVKFNGTSTFHIPTAQTDRSYLNRVRLDNDIDMNSIKRNTSSEGYSPSMTAMGFGSYHSPPKTDRPSTSSPGYIPAISPVNPHPSPISYWNASDLMRPPTKPVKKKLGGSLSHSVTVPESLSNLLYDDYDDVDEFL
jgi:hypothetical protein